MTTRVDQLFVVSVASTPKTVAIVGSWRDLVGQLPALDIRRLTEYVEARSGGARGSCKHSYDEKQLRNESQLRTDLSVRD